MEFSCQLNLIVVYKDAEAFLSKWIELPFAPWKGLMLELASEDCDQPDENTDWFYVETVEYYVPGGCFWLGEMRTNTLGCRCKPDERCCVFDETHYRTLGWEIVEVRRGEERLHEVDGMFDPDKTWSKAWDRNHATPTNQE